MTEHPTDAPDWFQKYTTLARNDHWITVAGARIHYQSWNDQEAKPGLLFVHGHAAHAHWWDFIAPAFIDKYKVAAMDMSGAGDSDHRDAYSAMTFAQEIFTVAQALGEDTIVVGHSLGGTMTRICGHLYGDRLGGIVIVDSNISRSRGKRTPLRCLGEKIGFMHPSKRAYADFVCDPPSLLRLLTSLTTSPDIHSGKTMPDIVSN